MSEPLDVFLDDRRAVTAAHTGIGTYAALLADGLARRDDVRLRRASEVGPPARRVLRGRGQAARLLADQVALPLAARGADVYHAVWHEGSPLQRLPLALSVHDLDMVRNADRYSRPQRWYYGGLLRPLLRRASVVMVPSNATARDFARWRPATRTEVVPYPVHPAFLEDPGGASGDVLGRHGLRPRGYALYTGGLHPRKGLETLFAGLARAQDHSPVELPLVLTGATRPAARHAAFAAGCRATFTGVVGIAELRALYAGAAVVVSASGNEGFGYSAAEALCAGRPFVCPDRGSLPETAGDVAFVFPTGDPEGLATRVLQALGEEDTMTERLALASADARARFSVDRATEAAVRCYKMAAGPRTAGRRIT